MDIVKTFPGTVTRHWEVFQYGKQVANSKNESVGSVGITSSKTSIDTGVFVPGKYRVNPYSVSHGEAFVGPGILRGSYTYADAPKTTLVDTVEFDNHFIWGANLKASVLALATPSTNLKDIALQKAYAKVGSAAAGQGENLGELRETLEMLRNPLRKLRDLLYSDAGRRNQLVRSLADLHKGTRKGALKKLTKLDLDTAAATWMEIRYGLRPLVKSIQDIAEQLQKQKKKILLGKIYSKRSYLTRETRVPNMCVFAYQEAGNLTNLFADYTGVVTVSANAAVQYRYTVLPPDLDTWGLNLQYLPETAWELTRMSFVVDWLFSVGPWLQSWRYNPCIEILGDIVGLKVKKEALDVRLKYNSNYVPQQPQPISTKVYIESYVRTVSNGRPTTPLFLGKAKLDIYKLVDSLCLLWQHKPK